MVQASPKKKFNFSRPVISFCTAVFVEVLGSMTTINSSVVGKIYGFLDYGLKASVNGGSDHQVRLMDLTLANLSGCFDLRYAKKRLQIEVA